MASAVQDRGRPAPPPSSLIPAAHAAVLALAGAAVVIWAYAAQLHGPFVFDDIPDIVRRTSLHLGARDVSLREWLLDGERPLGRLVIGLNHLSTGLDPFGFKVVNLALHLLAALSAFLFLRVLLPRGGIEGPFAPAAVAVLWAAHPAMTQVASYVVQRQTSLCAIFFLGACTAYLTWRSPAGRPRHLALTAALWVLAALSKEVAFSFPLAVAAYEAVFLEEPVRSLVRRVRPAALAGAGALVATLAAGTALLWRQTGGTLVDYFTTIYAHLPYGPVERVLTQPRVLLDYVSLILLPLPSRLSIDHAVAPSMGLLSPPSTLAAMVAVAAAVCGAVWLGRKAGQRLVAFGVLWFFAVNAVEASFVPIELMAEHRIYLPALGLAWALAAALRPLAPSGAAGEAARRGGALVLCLALLALLGAGTRARNRVWADDLLLWSDAAAKAPGSFRPAYNVGASLYARQRLDEAVPWFEKAAALAGRASGKETQWGYVPLAYYFAGNASLLAGKTQRAEEYLSRAIAADPGEHRAWAISEQRPFAYQELAGILSARRDFAAAERLLRTAVALRPDVPDFLRGLGWALLQQGKLPEAIEALLKAAALDPKSADSHYALGLAYDALGRRDAAEPHWRACLALAPRGTAAHRRALERVEGRQP